MAVLRSTNAVFNHFKSIFNFESIVYQEVVDACEQPGKDVFMERAFQLWRDHADVGKVAQRVFS